MGEKRYFEIIDRTTVFIGRMFFEFLVPSLLAEIQFGLQPQVLSVFQRSTSPALYPCFIFVYTLGLKLTDEKFIPKEAPTETS